MSGSAIAAWPEESEPMLAIEIGGAEIGLSRKRVGNIQRMPQR
jgi:hypothetical protein